MTIRLCSKLTRKFTKRQRRYIQPENIVSQGVNFKNWVGDSVNIKCDQIDSTEGWTALVYDLPDTAGTVVHARRLPGNTRIADKLLKKYLYKVGGKNFRRNKLKHSRGELDNLDCVHPARQSWLKALIKTIFSSDMNRCGSSWPTIHVGD